MSNNETHPKNISWTALSLAVGLILGGILGFVVDNLILFAGGGLVLGLAIGNALDNRQQKNKVS